MASLGTLPKTNKEPTIGEKKFAQEVLLHGEAPLWMQWVTKRKRDKVQDRLLVVGKYKVFSIKRTVTGKKTIRRVGHVFDLKEIFSGDVDKLVFKFKDFDIDIQAPGAGTDLLMNMRLNMQRYTYSFAEYALPKITLLPGERVLQPLPQIDPGPCHGILATYDAFCDYHNIVPNQEFVKFINDVALKSTTDFSFDECPGIERKELPINFVPIKSALRHNTYFQAFIFRNVPRRDIADMLSDTLTHNITIKKIVLSGCDARDEAFVNIGNSFKKNQLNAIVDVDFSNNNMKEKGAVGLGDGLQYLSHSLYRLNVSNCGLNTKGVSAILQSFCFGKEVAKSLTELDLSHNNVSSNGSVQLSNWFNQATVNCQLRCLLLSSSRAETALIFRTMKNATIRTVEEIDVSANKMEVQAAQALASVIDTLPRLQVLNLAYCNLTAQSVENILRSIVNNQSLADVTINISGNDIGVPGALGVAQILLVAYNIGALIMKSCGFKKEGLTKIIDAVGQNTERSTLKALDLGMNFATGTASKMLKLITGLGEAVRRHPTLEYLGLSGNGEKMAIGKEIEPLFKALATNPKLVELDISGNKIGDQLAVILCDQLKSNTNLKSLSWDNNQISIGGWRAFLTLVQSNKNVINCPLPILDVDRAIREAKNKEQFKDKIKEVLDAVRDVLKANSGGQQYVSIVKTKQGRTYGDNVKQFMTMGVSQSETAQPPPVVNNYQYQQSYDSGSPVVPVNQSYGSMPMPGGYQSDNSFLSFSNSFNSNMSYQQPQHYGTMTREIAESYGSPPPPPPPPPPPGALQRSAQNYDDPPPPPPRDEYEVDYQDQSYQQAYQYPTEYDDTQYEDSAPPPPPPPPL